MRKLGVGGTGTAAEDSAVGAKEVLAKRETPEMGIEPLRKRGEQGNRDEQPAQR